MSAENLSKLQRVQNRAARTVCVSQRITYLLTYILHILHSTLSVTLATCASQDPIQAVDVVFSITSVEWAALSLCSTTVISTPPCTLRSSTQHLLTVPRCRTVVDARRFSVASLEVWNSLKSTSKLPFSARTWTSQPLLRLRLRS